MSESVPYQNWQHGRFYRKLELLYWINQHKGKPAPKICAHLSKDPIRLNKGNSVRNQLDYLKEFQLADFGEMHDSFFFVSLSGKDYLKKEIYKIQQYLAPLKFEENYAETDKV